MGLKGSNTLVIPSNSVGCGFGAVGVLHGYYPTGIAAVFAFLLTYC